LLLGLFFNPEDGGEMFLRNAGWLSADYMTLYPRRQNSSKPCIIYKSSGRPRSIRVTKISTAQGPDLD
jgi:hypothetical protein